MTIKWITNRWFFFKPNSNRLK